MPNESLFDHIADQEFDEAREILQSNPELINATNGVGGDSVLFTAIYADDPDFVEEILSYPELLLINNNQLLYENIRNSLENAKNCLRKATKPKLIADFELTVEIFTTTCKKLLEFTIADAKKDPVIREAIISLALKDKDPVLVEQLKSAGIKPQLASSSSKSSSSKSQSSRSSNPNTFLNSLQQMKEAEEKLAQLEIEHAAAKTAAYEEYAKRQLKRVEGIKTSLRPGGR